MPRKSADTTSRNDTRKQTCEHVTRTASHLFPKKTFYKKPKLQHITDTQHENSNVSSNPNELIPFLDELGLISKGTAPSNCTGSSPHPSTHNSTFTPHLVFGAVFLSVLLLCLHSSTRITLETVLLLLLLGWWGMASYSAATESNDETSVIASEEGRNVAIKTKQISEPQNALKTVSPEPRRTSSRYWRLRLTRSRRRRMLPGCFMSDGDLSFDNTSSWVSESETEEACHDLDYNNNQCSINNSNTAIEAREDNNITEYPTHNDTSNSKVIGTYENLNNSISTAENEITETSFITHNNTTEVNSSPRMIQIGCNYYKEIENHQQSSFEDSVKDNNVLRQSFSLDHDMDIRQSDVEGEKDLRIKYKDNKNWDTNSEGVLNNMNSDFLTENDLKESNRHYLSPPLHSISPTFVYSESAKVDGLNLSSLDGSLPHFSSQLNNVKEKETTDDSKCESASNDIVANKLLPSKSLFVELNDHCETTYNLDKNDSEAKSAQDVDCNLRITLARSKSTEDLTDLAHSTLKAVDLFLQPSSAGVINNSNNSSIHVKNLLELTSDKLTQRLREQFEKILNDFKNQNTSSYTESLNKLEKFIIQDNFCWEFIRCFHDVLKSRGFATQKWPHYETDDRNRTIRAILETSVLRKFSAVIREILDIGLKILDTFNETNNYSNRNYHHPYTRSLYEDENANTILLLKPQYIDSQGSNTCSDSISQPYAPNQTLIENNNFNETTAVPELLSFTCCKLDFRFIKESLQHVEYIYSCLSSDEFLKGTHPQVQAKCEFVEDLIQAHFFAGSHEAISICQFVLSRFKYVLSLPAMRRCFAASSRSPFASEFCDTVEELYQSGAEGDANVLQRLRDQMWPLIIECRVHLKMYEKALALLDAYCKTGLQIPELVSPSIVRLGLECERLDLVHHEVEQGRTSLDGPSCVQLVQALSKRNDIQGALNVLEKLEQDASWSHGTAAYTAVLEVCIASEDIPTAEMLFGLMQQKNIVHLAACNLILKGYTKLNPPQLQKAWAFLQQMQLNFNVKPDVTSFNYLIEAAVQSDRMSLAWNLVDDMSKLSIFMDKHTQSIFIKALNINSSAYDRKRILQVIDGANICEDVVFFSTVVDACARINDKHRLRQALQRFHQSTLTPSVHSYGTLIKAHGKCQDINGVWRMWNEMIYTSKSDPTNYTYGCMFNALVSNGRVDEAVQLFKFAIEQGREPNTVQYSILIKGCAQEKHAAQALALYREMRERGVECNGITYNTLINTCAGAGDMDTAELILKDMNQSETCTPDVITYSTLIKGFCDQGKIDRAFELFNNMEQRGIVADGIVYNTLLEGYSKRMLVDEAETLFKRMLARNVAPSSFTLTILVKLYGRVHRLDEALRLAEELPTRYHFEFDAYVYTALMAACLMNSEIDKALFYFEKMNTGVMRQFVSGRTFGTIIIGCTKAMRFLTGYRFVLEAISRNLDVEANIIQRLGSTLAANQEHVLRCVSNPTLLASILPQIISFLTGYPNSRNLVSTLPELPSQFTDILSPKDTTSNNNNDSAATIATTGSTPLTSSRPHSFSASPGFITSSSSSLSNKSRMINNSSIPNTINHQTLHNPNFNDNNNNASSNKHYHRHWSNNYNKTHNTDRRRSFYGLNNNNNNDLSANIIPRTQHYINHNSIDCNNHSHNQNNNIVLYHHQSPIFRYQSQNSHQSQQQQHHLQNNTQRFSVTQQHQTNNNTNTVSPNEINSATTSWPVPIPVWSMSSPIEMKQCLNTTSTTATHSPTGTGCYMIPLSSNTVHYCTPAGAFPPPMSHPND